jgi:sugar phosphate isomerase/epimerase
VLVLVCGPPVEGDLPAARATIAAGIERLLPHAAACGVRLGIEPLHPMMVGERSAIVTLGEALALARSFDDPAVGVIVDAYHVFWDPRLDEELAGAGALIAGYHVSDWLVPTPDLLAGRGLMGDGIIDLGRLGDAVAAAGYDGPIEVEVINPALAALPPDALVPDIAARFEAI